MNILKFAKRLKSENYDFALVPHRSIRSAFIIWCANIPVRIGFNKSSGSFLFTDKIKYDNNVHEIERNLSLLTKFSTEIFNELPAIYPDNSDKLKVVQLLDGWQINNSNKIIGIAPGSIWPTKCWPENKFIELIQKLPNDYKVVLIGSKDDKKLCLRIEGKFDKNVYSTAGLLKLRQSAELIGRCRLIICNDSAPTHIAVAMKTKVITIFGPTIPAFGFYPIGQDDVAIEHKNLYCRPCGIHGGHKCPEKHFRCMKEISADLVLKEIL